MPATSEDRLFGLTTSVAVKPPVAISADYNVTTFGEQTITSSTMTGDRTVTTTQDMRVLLMNQDDKRDNGIWMAGPVTWRRAPDFDGSRDAVDGTLVFSIYGDCWQVEGTNPIRIGYDEISFRSTYPFSKELNLYQRTIRTSDLYIEPLPSLSEAEGKTIVVQSGVPRWVTPESGTATDVLTELAKSDGATKIGSQQPDGKSETVQQALSAIRKAVGSVNTLVSRGRVPALSGHNQGTAGIQMYEAYNNGYPTPYGNVIHLKGASTGGEGELLIGWSGTSISGAHAPVYIRSRRDVDNAPWSAWAQVFTANEIQAYTEMELDRRYQPKGAYSKPNTANKAAKGWWKCGDTGVVFQWGTVGVGDNIPVTFPIAFTSACISVQLSKNNSNYAGTSTANISATEKSRTGFIAHIYHDEVGGRLVSVGLLRINIMSYFYSKTTGGFYLESMRNEYVDWPADVVLVSDSDYEQLFLWQGKGKIITADASGYPISSDPPEPTHDELIAKADAKRRELMSEATQTISTLQDAVDLDMATKAERAQLVAWKTYRVLLYRVDISTAPDIEWPEAPEAEKTGN